MVSLFFGWASTISAVIGFQCKKQSQIVIAQCVSNLLVALSYIFLDITKISGGIICIIGAFQSFVNYLYFRREASPGRTIIIPFFFAYLFASLFTMYISGNINIPYDLLPMLGSIFFLLGISTASARNARLFFVANILIWLIYDCTAKPVAVGNMTTHICILISNIIGILRYDIRKSNR